MSEIADVHGVRLDYVVEGSGPPALVLHGAYSTRDESLPVFQPLLARRGMRGVHPDLPGMGASAQTSATSTGDVLNALDALIAAEIDGERFVVIGHSFGAHLARGVAARHPDRVAGIALVSPYVRDIDAGAREGRRRRRMPRTLWTKTTAAPIFGYFQVRTAATLERYRALRPAGARAIRRSGRGEHHDRRHDGPRPRRPAVPRTGGHPRRPGRRARRLACTAVLDRPAPARNLRGGGRRRARPDPRTPRAHRAPSWMTGSTARCARPPDFRTGRGTLRSAP